LPESSKQKTNATNLMHTLKPLTKQVKSIDKNLLNFKQIRASVITHWLKIEGLRKTQYNAGHRYISSTEKYLPNQIDGLIDDIAKFNPF
jgi:integrase/recombinase XerD